MKPFCRFLKTLSTVLQLVYFKAIKALSPMPSAPANSFSSRLVRRLTVLNSSLKKEDKIIWHYQLSAALQQTVFLNFQWFHNSWLHITGYFQLILHSHISLKICTQSLANNNLQEEKFSGKWAELDAWPTLLLTSYFSCENVRFPWLYSKTFCTSGQYFLH